MKGSCQCGNVKYEVSDDYLALAACYCTECQKVSTGIGGYSMFVAKDNFDLISGELSRWECASDIGTRNIAHFCPTCSNRIYSESPDTPGMIRLKAGTFENANTLEPDAHVWMKSAPGWGRLPEGALAFYTQPSIEEGLQAISERRQITTNR